MPRPRRRRKRAGDKALTRGHRIRRAVWDAAAADDRIVRFASEHSKLPRTDGVRVLAAAPEAKAGSVAPFAVHVAIENVRRAGLLHGEALDCFFLRTVPVYWGCPDLAAHGFDIDGVVFIDDGGDDEAAVARAAVAAVGRALDAPASRRGNRAQLRARPGLLDLEGRLVSVIDAALDDTKVWRTVCVAWAARVRDPPRRRRASCSRGGRPRGRRALVALVVGARAGRVGAA